MKSVALLLLAVGAYSSAGQPADCTPKLCRPDRAWATKNCSCAPITQCKQTCPSGQALHPSYACQCVSQSVIDDAWATWRQKSGVLVKGSAAYEDAKIAGYIGNGIYGSMCVLNTVYYMDIYRRKYWSQIYEGDIHFMEFWGAAAWGRIVLNIGLWGLLSFFWWFTIFYDAGVYQLNFYLMQGAGYVWFIRTFALIFLQGFALGYDKFDNTYGLHDYFKQVSSWGAELGVNEYFDSIDINLEAASLAGQAIAYPLYRIGMSVWNAKLKDKYACKYTCSGEAACERKLADCKAKLAQEAAKKVYIDRAAPYFNKNEKFMSIGF